MTDLLRSLHQFLSIPLVLSHETGNDIVRTIVDVVHQLYLMISLPYAFLVNAYGIDPEVPRLMTILQVTNYSRETSLYSQ